MIKAYQYEQMFSSAIFVSLGGRGGAFGSTSTFSKVSPQRQRTILLCGTPWAVATFSTLLLSHCANSLPFAARMPTFSAGERLRQLISRRRFFATDATRRDSKTVSIARPPSRNSHQHARKAISMISLSKGTGSLS